jgi:RHS repeat-associated protein
MLEAAKKEIFSVPMVWTGQGVLPLGADPASLEDHSVNERTSAATHFGTTTQLRKNSRLGFARKNAAPHQGSAWSNSASALEITAVLLESRDGSRYQGKERDTETGNDDFGARYYTSRFGRWLSADWSSTPVPVPYANLSNPQTLNLYSMVSDDPESFADLDGHCWPPSACADVIDSYVQVFRQDGMAVNDHTSPAVAAINTFANGVTADLASGAADVLRLGNGLAAAIDSAKQGDYLGAASNLSQDGGRVGQVILGVTAVAASGSPAVNAQEVAQKAGPGNTSPETPAGRVDLTGDSHYSKAAGKDIDTPHVHENASNTNPATGQTYNFQQKVPRPATNADVNAAAKAANVRITPKPVPIKPKPPEQQ